MTTHWREDEDLKIPWWVREDISLLEQIMDVLRQAPQPTQQTGLAYHTLLGQRLKMLSIGMRGAQMAPDETIAAYLAHIGVAETTIKATLERRAVLLQKCRDYWQLAASRNDLPEWKEA